MRARAQRVSLLVALVGLSCGARSGLPDTRADPDANLSVLVELTMDEIWLDCMPSEPPGMVGLTGQMRISNNGTSPVGPIQPTSGRLLSEAGTDLGSFALKPFVARVIQPSESLYLKLEKTAGSLALTCQSCDQRVRVEIAYDGMGLPPDSKAISELVPVSCAY